MFSHPELMFLQLTERGQEAQQRDRQRRLRAALRHTRPTRGRRRIEPEATPCPAGTLAGCGASAGQAQ